METFELLPSHDRYSLASTAFTSSDNDGLRHLSEHFDQSLGTLIDYRDYVLRCSERLERSTFVTTQMLPQCSIPEDLLNALSNILGDTIRFNDAILGEMRATMDTISVAQRMRNLLKASSGSNQEQLSKHGTSVNQIVDWNSSDSLQRACRFEVADNAVSGAKDFQRHAPSITGDLVLPESLACSTKLTGYFITGTGATGKPSFAESDVQGGIKGPAKVQAYRRLHLQGKRLAHQAIMPK
jgi:hypothetical protein